MTDFLRERHAMSFPTRLVAISALILVSSACEPESIDVSAGISWDLASHRARTISNLRYDIRLTIPAERSDAVTGRITASFDLADASEPVVLDFRVSPDFVTRVAVGDVVVDYEFRDGHVIVPAAALAEGPVRLTLEFIAGDLSLNRNAEYLYTLFVPERASTSLPLFDQPNLKARYTLTLDVPPSWTAVANGPLAAVDTLDGTHRYRFAETRPISTYLFSFAAGRFEVETTERDGRELRMYHRETDARKVARNREAIFDLHATPLDWLETYTDIDYPFQKFDFVLIPSFQYGGMEHPGAILYRASSLFLEAATTQQQLLGRASLIAHETAHMWFGDLVTMDWFDDVWMKEVFANFMAAKIAQPSFPEIDHEQRFLLAHHPTAYGVDRTAGANPIRQPLENLLDAGSLYGAIIYQKAPIVMRQLENLIGEDAFQTGMRTYLEQFAYDNATWPDLIEILDDLSPSDLTAWSDVWVGEAGRPLISVEFEAVGGAIDALTITQEDPTGAGRIWPQRLGLGLGYGDSLRIIDVDLEAGTVTVPRATGMPAPDFIVPNADGLSYGHFRLDPRSVAYLAERLADLPTPLLRSITAVDLWEAVLDGTLGAYEFVDAMRGALERERNELATNRLLGYIAAAYWRYLTPEQRLEIGVTIEETVWRLLTDTEQPTLKATYFNTYRTVAESPSAMERLRKIWSGETEIPGLPLAERDLTLLAQELAVREVDGWAGILTTQRERITNADRVARFQFVEPALNADSAVRMAFFETLRDPANREHEPWVLEALRYLHHPLRAESAEHLITPSLELLEEIQRTGDIFFPKRWLDATFTGHRSATAAARIREFLESPAEIPPRLRAKIQQSADPVFRAARLADADTTPEQ